MFGLYALPALWLFPPRLGAAVRPRPQIINTLQFVTVALWIDPGPFQDN